MHLQSDYEYLKKEALWVIVDPVINPNNDENMNFYDVAFLDKLRQDIDEISNKVVYSESTLPIHEYFKYLPLYKTINQLVLDSGLIKNYVFCGLHYGMCVHKAVKECKQRVDIDNNFFVKRDLSCLMPFDGIKQHDLNLTRSLGVRLI
jgi:hypothetical protein